MTRADPIRAALERLIELNEECTEEQWTDAIAAARAALAEQQGNEAQVSLFVDSHIDPEHQGEDRQILHVFYDACMSEGGTADEIHLRGLRAVLARYGHQPAPPADGEVAELAEFLRIYGDEVMDEYGDVGEHDQLTRAADLLEQRRPAPVPVSERLPGPEDCDAEGRCWLLTVEDEYPQWRLHSIEGNQPGGSTMIWVPVDSSPGVMVDAFYASHWLPATALPLPQGEVE